MNFYAKNLALLCALCAILLYRRHRRPVPQLAPFDAARLETARNFHWRFLVPYALASAPPGGFDKPSTDPKPFQGPHLFALYRDDKQLPEQDIALLYAIGFLSAAVSTIFAGQFIEFVGRRAACSFCCCLNGFSTALVLCRSMPILMLGRVLGGMATTLLFSAFETWMICEYHSLELDESTLPLKTVLENMALVNSAVAMLSGVAGDALVGASGMRGMPFYLANLCCPMAQALVLFLWRDDKPRGSLWFSCRHVKSSAPVVEWRWRNYQLGIKTVLTNKKISALTFGTCCFEGAMYLFIFFWTAALTSVRLKAGVDEKPPLGLIFSSFMCAMMAGSLVSATVKAPSRQSATMDLYLAMVIGSGSLSCAVLFEDERKVFWAFCVLEATIGAYFPAMGFLKSEFVDDNMRGHVYGALRLPLNLFVLMAHMLDREGSLSSTATTSSHARDATWRHGLLSAVVLAAAATLILGDAKLLLLQPALFLLRASHHLLAVSRSLSSEPAPVCLKPAFFATVPPVSRPLTMALADETTRVVAQFDFSDGDINRHVGEFLHQMNDGLEREDTSISQIPTYVTGVPNGTEKGLYLAVDLGGTNFRVCSITLNGDTTFNLTYNKVAIPKQLMVADTARELFAFLAKQIELFLREHHAEHFESHVRRRNTSSTPLGYRDEHIFRLGFTFSFPVKQLGINKGRLIRWTKGFDIPDAVGKDVCALLQQEIDLLRLPVKVAALVNDTVGTLMARSYTSDGKHRSILGGIFGTGTNGAYIEKTSNIKKRIEGEYDKSTGEMVVNTEWGSFDNQLNVLPTTPWDRTLDNQSVNPGFQMFEKRVSGMFLGEIVRLAVLDMMKNEATSLFRDLNSSFNDWGTTTSISPQSGMLKPWGLDSAIMSVAASDNSPELSTLRQELENVLQVYNPSLEDAQAFKAVCNAVARRAARLSAVAIGAVALKSGKVDDPNEEVLDIGVDGSLVEHYPFFRDMIYEALLAVDGIGPQGVKKIRIGIAKDGSGVGAALIALVAQRMEKPGDFLADLRMDIRRSMDAMAQAEEESRLSRMTYLAAGILGFAAVAAIWWNRQR
ncbi:hypothetical protein L249_4711 [Ophiocordyceps polyrhachis-furcata BCC 54312]|uniref:glucokinase n=1 Tax=Ophiocordyceps polyrhachis-furcata BCC 54312 TaxID=1330021 RepID=A0A367L2H6_9HYPO|nr:hypothetical protein L249_4711 [Ophiocordyceps polyrhachis-furcata BCC 54312]